MKRLLAIAVLATASLAAIPAPPSASADAPPPNVIILMSDDQRWDTLTSRYMPNVWDLGHAAASATLGGHEGAIGTAFRNSFVPNALCCPSRASTLTGNYSQTTGVWDNHPPFGGWPVFHDGPEADTIATDFQSAGYRTALIGKYLNGYQAGEETFVPPGWSKWFASNTGAFYDYGITTTTETRQYSHTASDYISRVLNEQAQKFVINAQTQGQPFFLYYAFTAPHGPAVPDPRDVGRFAGEPDFKFSHTKWPSSQLNSAYSVDRAVGQLLRKVPDNTIVVYISDNGYLWGENRLVPTGGTANLIGKQWPYNESIRVPMVYASLDGTHPLVAARDDLVLNVDLRESLLSAAGIVSDHEGLNWFDPAYVARDSFVLEHTYNSVVPNVPTYCGARSKDYMYVRFSNGYELFYDEAVGEQPAMLLDPAAVPAELKELAQTCQPPDGYTWGP